MIDVGWIILGLLYAIAGFHVLNWCCYMHVERMNRLAGWADRCMPPWLSCTVCILLWPLLLVGVLCMKDTPRAA